MARKPTGKPNGRPPRDYDPKVFEGLCLVWCTNDEICSIFRCDIRSVDAWCKRHYGESFNDSYKRFSAGGYASLRRNQFNLSKTNAAMAIWLGKQKLGQKENPETLEDFNGKLSLLLEKLNTIETKSEFKRYSENLLRDSENNKYAQVI